MAKNESELVGSASTRGGYRPGAGRPKGTKNRSTTDKERLREALRRHVARHFKSLVDAQVAVALGRKYLVRRDKRTGKFVRVTRAMAGSFEGTDEDTIEVWEADPSTTAFTDLMNRVLDKPKEQELKVRVSGEVSLVARLQAARNRLARSQVLPPAAEHADLSQGDPYTEALSAQESGSVVVELQAQAHSTRETP
jgi:hypothetical protein